MSKKPLPAVGSDLTPTPHESVGLPGSATPAGTLHRWTYLSLLVAGGTQGVVCEARSLVGPDIAFFLSGVLIESPNDV